MIKGLIHDWDGTIYDSMDVVLRTYSVISGRTVENLRKFYSPDWKKFQREAKIPDYTNEEWCRIFREQSKSSRLFSGSRGYLQKIKRDGKRLVLATSADLTRLKNDLAKTKLNGIFDLAVTLEDVKEIKPNPECLEVAVRKLNAAVEDCAYVGDTVEDALAARTIEMKFIGVGWGYNSPEAIRKINGDEVASNFDELYDIVRNL
jgi:HAD superfamily hydrolase (TIGR01509 family)